jgi:glycosyltransferase involved in cell wall biosynthesis
MHRAINPWRDFVCFLRIYKKLKQENFDIVHAHSSKAGFLARVAARLARVPVVIYSPHAFAFNRPGTLVKKLPYILLEKIASFFCDAIIAVSPSERELALKFKIINQGKIKVVSPSLNLEDYNQKITEEKKKEFLKTLTVPLENRVVTMIGRLSPQKDPLTFIYSYSFLKDYPALSFLLVGDGPMMEKCRQKIRGLGLHDAIKVLGWRRDCITLLQISDAVVNTSLWEGLPYTLLEAMASERPVVATKATGNIDLITDGENGFLVPPRSPKLLAEKIKLILDNPSLASKIGKEAKKTVEHNYSLEKTIPMIEEFYLQLFNNKIR